LVAAKVEVKAGVMAEVLVEEATEGVMEEVMEVVVIQVGELEAVDKVEKMDSLMAEAKTEAVVVVFRTKRRFQASPHHLRSKA
jgi:hypothetical protein